MTVTGVLEQYPGPPIFEKGMFIKTRALHNHNLFLAGCVVFFAFLSQAVPAQNLANLPQLRKQGAATQLIVDGKPFLILGGELGNSSSSDAEYMRAVWPKLARMNLNTVLMPVYWELLEPEEGKFDFTLVDALINDARKNNLRIVPLWFATWKNSMSTYVPAWVKRGQKRFPRSVGADGRGIEILSTFSRDVMEADAKAFAAFMRHLRETDIARTVIMVQVENEIGMIPDSRDRSAEADRLFNAEVPAELTSYLSRNKESLIPEFLAVWAKNGFKTKGTWEEVFGKGPGTDEIFMAWYFARFTNRVAEAGKAEYPLPMYVNGALIRPGYMPGQYPSAGPLPHIMDVWRAGAPKIDMLSPDIYFPNVTEWVRKYDRSGNAMFIPEIQMNSLNSVHAMWAIAQHNSIGFSPFSIENADESVGGQLAAGYDLIAQLAPLILENQGKGTMLGLIPDSPDPQRVPQELRLGGYKLNVTYERPAAGSPSGGLIIATGTDEFLIAGTSLVVTFTPDTSGDAIAGLLSVQEGTFVNGIWKGGRWLNGDQTHQGRHVRLDGGKFGIQKVKLYRYR
jgi:beta-galactosidase GanA